MKYWLHPEAAEEHKKQVAYYEEIQAGLGSRYHTEFRSILATVCASPDRSRIVLEPDIRRSMFKIFHFDLIYREVDGSVQVLAIAHQRRQPGYWVARL
ncbi:type II toxin-antitoxin system RelE/ParE family toxin [Rhodoferax sp.]|uniref:type II toxin-antitoxin system RelE/ParE family toxin n=1 Tax=Rhodoferax sp. TaxID=50421 RepID=UPI002758C601|nr:type II toxin-antitoxin system RelE/ParE family toxin [Rhodoferax sp.]